MADYYRLMLARGSMHARECFDGSFIGTDFGRLHHFQYPVLSKLGRSMMNIQRLRPFSCSRLYSLIRGAQLARAK